MAEKPYVFVAGCPWSRTTLLQRMLDNHPQPAVANEASARESGAVTWAPS